MVNYRNNSGAASEDVARLAGSRFVSVNETEEGQRWDESKIKSLTGGDKMVARNLYKDSFEFEMKAKIWVRTNNEPEFRGNDMGIKRRMRKIPFNVHIPKDQRDMELPEKLKKEYTGILAAIVRGCLQWQKLKLDEPEIVLNATQEYLDQMDFLGQFFAYLFPEGNFAEQKASDMFEAFSSWAMLTGNPALSQTRFGRILNQRGWTTQKKHGTIWRIPPLNRGIVDETVYPSGKSFQTIPNQEPSAFTVSSETVGESSPLSLSIGVFAPIDNIIYNYPQLSPKEEKERLEYSDNNDYGVGGQFEKSGDSLKKESKKNLPKTEFLNESIAFVDQCLKSGQQYGLVQLCKRGGLGDSYPAVKRIQSKDYTTDNWANRAYAQWLTEQEEKEFGL
jgi:hypothetical protein